MMEWIDKTTENHMTRDHMEITMATMSHNTNHLINPITSQNIHHMMEKMTDETNPKIVVKVSV